MSRHNARDKPERDEIYLLPSEAAAMLKVTAKTISRWAKEGKLPHIVTLGGHRRFRLTDVLQLAERLGLTDYGAAVSEEAVPGHHQGSPDS